MFAPLAIVVLTASSAFAIPRALPRADDPCAKFGGSAFGNGGPFTLVAMNNLSNQTNLLVLSPPVGTGASDLNRRSLAVSHFRR